MQMTIPTIQEIGAAFQRLTNIENSDTDRTKAIAQMKAGDSTGFVYAERHCKRILDANRGGNARTVARQILADIVTVRGSGPR